MLKSLIARLKNARSLDGMTRILAEIKAYVAMTGPRGGKYYYTDKGLKKYGKPPKGSRKKVQDLNVVPPDVGTERFGILPGEVAARKKALQAWDKSGKALIKKLEGVWAEAVAAKPWEVQRDLDLKRSVVDFFTAAQKKYADTKLPGKNGKPDPKAVEAASRIAQELPKLQKTIDAISALDPVKDNAKVTKLRDDFATIVGPMFGSGFLPNKSDVDALHDVFKAVPMRDIVLQKARVLPSRLRDDPNFKAYKEAPTKDTTWPVSEASYGLVPGEQGAEWEAAAKPIDAAKRIVDRLVYDAGNTVDLPPQWAAGLEQLKKLHAQAVAGAKEAQTAYVIDKVKRTPRIKAALKYDKAAHKEIEKEFAKNPGYVKADWEVTWADKQRRKGLFVKRG